jgi:hypothetical protein
MRFLPAFLALISSTAHATCPFEKPFNLQDQIVVAIEGAGAKIKEALKEKPPFNRACQFPGAITGRPKTNLLKREVPQRDSNGHSSQAFLKLVAAKVREKIETNANMTKDLAVCLQSSAPVCADAQNWARVQLPEFVKEARFHLSVAQSPYQFETRIGTQSLWNYRLDPLGTPKMVDWSYVSDQELVTARKTLDYYEREQTAQAKAGNPDSLLTRRFQHFEAYQTMMSTLPFVQYIRSESPDIGEIRYAVSETLKNIDKEQKAFVKIEKDIRKNPVPAGALKILAYASIVESVLLENPQYCGLATALQYSANDREIQNMIATGLPILAVSLIAPPLAGFAVGVAASASTIVSAQSNLNAERVRSFSQVYGDADYFQRVAAAQKRRDFSVVFAPMGLGAGGAVLSRVGSMLQVGSAVSKVGILTRAQSLAH